MLTTGRSQLKNVQQRDKYITMWKLNSQLNI